MSEPEQEPESLEKKEEVPEEKEEEKEEIPEQPSPDPPVTEPEEPQEEEEHEIPFSETPVPLPYGQFTTETCPFIITRGPRKGTPCGKKGKFAGGYCKMEHAASPQAKGLRGIIPSSEFVKKELKSRAKKPQPAPKTSSTATGNLSPGDDEDKFSMPLPFYNAMKQSIIDEVLNSNPKSTDRWENIARNGEPGAPPKPKVEAKKPAPKKPAPKKAPPKKEPEPEEEEEEPSPPPKKAPPKKKPVKKEPEPEEEEPEPQPKKTPAKKAPVSQPAYVFW
jgi:hypothetical protein